MPFWLSPEIAPEDWRDLPEEVPVDFRSPLGAFGDRTVFVSFVCLTYGSNDPSRGKVRAPGSAAN
jgi:hypothetical protein